MNVYLKHPFLMSLFLSMGVSIIGCKARTASAVKQAGAENNSFSDNDVTGPTEAEQQEFAQLMNDRRDMAASFNNDFNSVISRITQSERNTGYVKILQNYYQGNLVGTFTKQEYENFEATWNTMRKVRTLVEKNERRLQELLIGKYDGAAISKIMLPYDFRLRVVLKALEPGLNKKYSDVLIEDAGQFLNFVTDTSTAQAGAAVAYASEVLSSMYPPSQEVYERNAAGIRDLKKLAVSELIPNFNGVAADIFAGLTESMQQEAAQSLLDTGVLKGVQKFWGDDIEKILQYYKPGSSGMNLAGDSSGISVKKTWNWLAALPFKAFTFNAGALGTFSTGGRQYYGQYIKRYRYMGNGNLEFCTNWTAKLGAGLGLGKFVGIPYGIGFQWDYELFGKGSTLSRISHFALIKSLTGMDTGLDTGVGFDVGLKVPLLPGVIGNAYYSPTSDVLGGDVQMLYFAGLGKTLFAGASAQVHQNLTCTNRGTHYDHLNWIKNKAKEKWSDSSEWAKEQIKENLPNWASATGVDKLTVGEIMKANGKK